MFHYSKGHILCYQTRPKKITIHTMKKHRLFIAFILCILLYSLYQELSYRWNYRPTSIEKTVHNLSLIAPDNLIILKRSYKSYFCEYGGLHTPVFKRRCRLFKNKYYYDSDALINKKYEQTIKYLIPNLTIIMEIFDRSDLRYLEFKKEYIYGSMNYWNNDLYFIIPKIKHETQTGDIILKKNVSYIYPYPIDSFEIKGDSSFRYLIIKKRHIERKQRELESRAQKKSDKGLEDQASLYKERANELGTSLFGQFMIPIYKF